MNARSLVHCNSTSDLSTQLTLNQKMVEILKIVRQLAGQNLIQCNRPNKDFESYVFPIRRIDEYFAFKERLSNDRDYKKKTVNE